MYKSNEAGDSWSTETEFRQQTGSETMQEDPRWKVCTMLGSTFTKRLSAIALTIPAVGPVTALTWALEIGDVSRFRSLKQVNSYAGLCADERRAKSNTGCHFRRSATS